MEIRIILQEDYDCYTSGKELIVTPKKYASMMEEGIKMRPMSPERLKANISKVETATADHTDVETATKPKEKINRRKPKSK